MFDLDVMEAEWKEKSFKLSEEEIIEIYRSDGATRNSYLDELRDYEKNICPYSSPEERLLQVIFGETTPEEIAERERKLKEKYKEPEKKYLSEEKRKIVVEGCLDLVFHSTRYWYLFFENKISIERLYYVCLEALINVVRYTMHNEKPSFSKLVEVSIEKNIIKNVARWEHLTYRDVYKIIDKIFFYKEKGKNVSNFGLCFNYDNEVIEKPSSIYHRLRNDSYDVDYIKDISSDEFMIVYNKMLGDLDSEEKLVMQLIFDNNGNRGLTYKEIGDYLGIDSNKILNIKRRVMRKMRKDKRLEIYKN